MSDSAAIFSSDRIDAHDLENFLDELQATEPFTSTWRIVGSQIMDARGRWIEIDLSGDDIPLLSADPERRGHWEQVVKCLNGPAATCLSIEVGSNRLTGADGFQLAREFAMLCSKKWSVCFYNYYDEVLGPDDLESRLGDSR